MSAVPAGWYDDGHGALRWWDGYQWTDHVHAPQPPAPPQPVFGAEPETATSVPPVPEPTQSAPEFFGASEYVGAQGYAANGGYPVAPAAPQGPKSKLWIVFLIAGIVVVLLIAAAAILIPLAINGLSSGASGSTDDERAAVAAVRLYDDAWDRIDCEEYKQATTDDFRATSIDDCDDFESEAQAFVAALEDYQVRITKIDSKTDDESITIETVETYKSLVDADGNPVQRGEPREDHYRYTLVESGDGWAIDVLDSPAGTQ